MQRKKESFFWFGQFWIIDRSKQKERGRGTERERETEGESKRARLGECALPHTHKLEKFSEHGELFLLLQQPRTTRNGIYFDAFIS